MTYLLDTNVLSEVRKPLPNAKVIEWLGSVDEDRVSISVVSLGEIRRGVALMEAGRRRDALELWLQEDLPQRFEGRLLAIDVVIADRWGVLMAGSRKRGVTLNPIDGFIAATAQVHDLTLVTRNTRDFEALGITLFDPWALS